ncbi:bacteriocin immunity protein [Pseudomonas entomophila]|uniref:bacteriocin immunity protein n=1 Tax=Pseudomonas entomophila TaxID=312306 RepID=UPI0023D8A2F4|nr:bacteriocin immunity protein [Pseudomonas entomophila]MDF0732708.1 bacteriocin immunity protein [Pseudomonas entomophila]
MKIQLSDYTETEFLAFVRKTYYANFPSEAEQIEAVLEFERLTEHPSGSDLLYYPEPGKDGPEFIVAEVKAWRAANGKPGFKAG